MHNIPVHQTLLKSKKERMAETVGMANCTVIRDFTGMCGEGFRFGWNERNGGNASLRLTPAEIAECRPFFYGTPSRWIPLTAPIRNLGGAFLVVTAAGSFMRNVESRPEENSGIAEISPDGSAYRIVWGFSGGGRPTSEFQSHLLCHSVKKDISADGCRVLYHAHPSNIVALTFILPLTAQAFSRTLWRGITECPFVFPAGVGVLPWMLPGSAELAEATAGLMETFDVAVWAHHGVFCAAATPDLTFGLMHTIEKSAEICIKVRSCGQNQTVSSEQLLETARQFGVTLNEKLLSDA